MVNRKAVRRKNRRILLVALSVLGLAGLSDLVSVGYGIPFGAGFALVVTAGILTLCVIGGGHRREAVLDEK